MLFALILGTFAPGWRLNRENEGYLISLFNKDKKLFATCPLNNIQEKVRSHALVRGARGWRAVRIRARQKPPGIPGHTERRRGAAGAGAAELRGGWTGGLQQNLVPFAWG
jgi:hypothetical protein